MRVALMKIFHFLDDDGGHSPYGFKGFPLNLGYLKAYMDHNAPEEFDVQIFRFAGEVVAFQPDVIGLSVHTPAAMAGERYARFLQEKTGAILICGGPFLTALPDQLGIFDYGIIGEGERSFYRLLKRLQKGEPATNLPGVVWRSKGQIRWQPEEDYLDLDTIPIPLQESENYFQISTTRGCPYHCTHCSQRTFWKKVRLLSAERIAEVLIQQYNQRGMKEFHALDDNFTVSRERIFRLHGLLKQRGMLRKLSLKKISITLNVLDDDLLRALYEIGAVDVGFGIEGISDPFLKMVKPHIRHEHFEQALKMVNRYPFENFGASVVIGFPGEEYQETLGKLEFFERNAGLINRWGGYVCQPFPGSSLWEGFSRGKALEDIPFEKMRISPRGMEDYADWIYLNEDILSKRTFVKLYQRLKQESAESYGCSNRDCGSPIPWSDTELLLTRELVEQGEADSFQYTRFLADDLFPRLIAGSYPTTEYFYLLGYIAEKFQAPRTGEKLYHRAIDRFHAQSWVQKLSQRPYYLSSQYHMAVAIKDRNPDEARSLLENVLLLEPNHREAMKLRKTLQG